MSDATLLVNLIRDALVGVPVKIGYFELPKLMKAIEGMHADPAARIAVFEAAVRGCITADSSLKARLRDILAKEDDTVRVQTLQGASHVR